MSVLTARAIRKIAKEKQELKLLTKTVTNILEDNDLDADPDNGKWPDRIGQIFGQKTLSALKAIVPNSEGYRQIIQILDSAVANSQQNDPQPDPEVIAEFMRMVKCLSVNRGRYRLLANGSITKIDLPVRHLHTPLLLRPRLEFPQGGFLFSDWRLATFLRNRMKTMMFEVERQGNSTKFLLCDEIFEL